MKDATPLIPRRQGKESATSSAKSSNQSDQFVADNKGTQQHVPRMACDSAVEVEEVAAQIEDKQDTPVEAAGCSPYADSTYTENDVSGKGWFLI